MQIDLWLTDYRTIDDPALQARMRALLSNTEQAREQRFSSHDERLRYLVTRAMLRTVLSRYAHVAPASWTFEQNAYGRPMVAFSHRMSSLRFNLSHTRGMIALAIGSDCELGVDVENLSWRPAPIGIARRFFCASELAELESLAAVQQHDRFFEYWTVKEAFIKACGLGLSMPLKSFSVHMPGSEPVQLRVDEMPDAGSRWRFWQCRPAPDILLALCSDQTRARITVRKIVPTHSESIVQTTWLRC